MDLVGISLWLDIFWITELSGMSSRKEKAENLVFNLNMVFYWEISSVVEFGLPSSDSFL